MIGRWLKKVVLTVGLIAFFAVTAVAETDITFSWTANPVEDDVDYYTVYYGNESRNYTESENMGNVTEYTLRVADGKWFIAITATDNSVFANESGYSNEVYQEVDTAAPSVPKILKVMVVVKVNVGEE